MAASRWRLVEFGDVAARAENAAAWNDLWQRSPTSVPTARFEHLLLWQRSFAPRNRLFALVVEQRGRWVAALPLAAGSLKRALPIYKLPRSEWSFDCDLLVDTAADDVPQALDQLACGIQSLRRPFVWFDCVPLDAPGWQAFLAALTRQGCPFDIAPRFEIGEIGIRRPHAPDNFEEYFASLSGNFRRQMRKMVRRAEELGGVDLVVERPQRDAEIDALVRQGFEVEDRSWKGDEGTSVLKSGRVIEFYCAQARQLARDGALELAFLMHQGEPIAFEYAYFSKGTYFTPKVGYDQRFSQLTPSQLLRYRLIETFFSDPSRQTFDFIGALVEATAKWSTHRYPVSRLLVSTGRSGGNGLLRTAQRLAPRLRALRSARLPKPSSAEPAIPAIPARPAW